MKKLLTEAVKNLLAAVAAKISSTVKIASKKLLADGVRIVVLLIVKAITNAIAKRKGVDS